MDALPVVWSRRAQRDRDRIFSYISAHDSPSRAYEVVRAIAERAAWLAEFPEGGKEFCPGRREVLVSRLPYVIEYERRPDKVRILYIWHQAQDRRTKGRSTHGKKADD